MDTEESETTACTACDSVQLDPPKQAKSTVKLFAQRLIVKLNRERMRWHAGPFESGKRSFHDEQRAQCKEAVMRRGGREKEAERRGERQKDIGRRSEAEKNQLVMVCA